MDNESALRDEICSLYERIKALDAYKINQRDRIDGLVETIKTRNITILRLERQKEECLKKDLRRKDGDGQYVTSIKCGGYRFILKKHEII
jgi:hypothetical protein